MRRMVLTQIVLLFIAVPVFAADMMKALQHEGQLCVNALVNHDVEDLIQYTHPIVIELSGGHDQFVLAIRQGIREMEDQGVSFVSADVEKPTLIKKIHGKIYAVLPQILTMRAPGGTLVSDGHLLAVSNGGGHPWYFVDMAPLNNENIASVFPDLADTIDIPVKQRPRFIPDHPVGRELSGLHTYGFPMQP